MVYAFLISLFPIIILIAFKSSKSLQMLQQNWYNLDNKYIKWMDKNRTKVFINIDMFFIVLIVLIFVKSYTAMILFIIFYTIVSLLYYKNLKNEQTKLKLVYTARIKRLLTTIFLLYLLPVVYMALTFDETNIAYYYLIIGALIYLNYFIVLFANYINIPVEKTVVSYYRNKAISKLDDMNNLEVIGITGSYGKTSSKNVLNDILNIKFNSFPSPKNFNTPLGLMNTINNYLDKFSDYFIAEMGAFKLGEIKELCDLVKPKYGILTCIGEAHLESFGSKENIQTTKFELIESLPSDGVGILNKDDPYQVNYKLNNDCKIIWISIHEKGSDIRAENITLSNNGTSFDCVFKGDKKKYHFETKLLGEANVYNILAGIALGNYLGLTKEQLQAGVKKVKPADHRLELKKYGNVNLIDDSYNSNPTGAKMALDVLNLMPGKKIVVTPGMIELGERQYEANLEFGKHIATVADEVILIGKEQTIPIFEGLKINDFNEKKIHVLNDVMSAYTLINKLKSGETYALFENDLPDLFNER